MEDILKIIAGIGGWAVLTAAIATFIGQRIADKLNIKWRREQEEKLERLRAEITREHSIFTTILNSYSSGHQFAQSNRIQAVQTLWENILALRNLGKVPSFFFGVLLEKEYNQIYDNKQIMTLLNSLSVRDALEVSKINENVEKYRPFLGEHLWSLYSVYSILVGRVIFLLAEGRDDRNIIFWHKDKYIQSILNEALTVEERKSVYSMDLGSFKEATRLLEQKLLFEMFKVTSGELAAESNLSKSKSLQEAIRQMDLDYEKFKENEGIRGGGV